MKKLIVGFVTVTVLGSAVFAMGGMGCQKGFMGKHHRGGFMMPIMRDLKLSNEQRLKIMDIVQDSFKDIKTPADAFSKDGFDKAKFIKIAKSKRGEMIEKRADNMEKIYDILTDEQKSKFVKMIKDNKSRFGW